LLRCPLGGGVGGDAGEVKAPGVVFDEDEGVQAFECDGVEVEEIGGDDAVGLGGEELPPGWAGALWCGVDAGSVQDLPDGGGCDLVSEAGEFTLDAPVAPGVILPGQAPDEFPDGRRSGRSAGTAAFVECPLSGEELPVSAQQGGWGDREDVAPAVARDQPGEDGEPDPVAGLVADPGDLTAQHRVFMPQCQ
jgi:hypothetical protein